jgi:hypothetical protein
MPLAFLLSLQAAGMIVDWFGKRNQIEMARMGEKITQAGIESNIEMTRLESEDASLQNMKNLRLNLGAQAAWNAARGTRSGAGSALALTSESIANFKADERARVINTNAKIAGLKAGIAMSKLHQGASEARIWNEFSQSVINKIPTSPSAWSAFGKSSSSSGAWQNAKRNNIASGNLPW